MITQCINGVTTTFHDVETFVKYQQSIQKATASAVASVELAKIAAKPAGFSKNVIATLPNGTCIAQVSVWEENYGNVPGHVSSEKLEIMLDPSAVQRLITLGVEDFTVRFLWNGQAEVCHINGETIKMGENRSIPVLLYGDEFYYARYNHGDKSMQKIVDFTKQAFTKCAKLKSQPKPIVVR